MCGVPQHGALTRICGTPMGLDSDLGSDRASTSEVFSRAGEVGAAGVGVVDGSVTAYLSTPAFSTDTDSGAALAAGLRAVDLEDAVHGPTIRAIEWAFHILIVPWPAGSIRPDSVAAEPTAVNLAVSIAPIPARRWEAALMPGRAQADGAHSMATIGRPRKVTAMRPPTIVPPRLRSRRRAGKAIPPRDPIHRQAATLLHRPPGAFPARDPSQLPAPQEEASPVDIRASLEEGIPEAVEADGNSRGAQKTTPFLTAYKISSARLCKFSFS